MISYEEALQRILDQVQVMPEKVVPLEELNGYVTARSLVSPLDLPPFDNSAVDGFGVNLADVAGANGTPVKLVLRETLRAGDVGSVRLLPGHAIKILTGAVVPPSVEAVVMKEYCEESPGFVYVSGSAVHGQNIRRRGAEFLRGSEVLDGGVLATPPVVGLLASLGYRSASVFRKPKAAVVTTGNELTKPGRPLAPGRIYDSNSFAMLVSLKSCGIEDCVKLHAAESYVGTKKAFERALAFADVVISTGGVSVGDFDFVKPVLEELGLKTELWKIAIKPGKPVYFGVMQQKGKRRNKYVFGLPGNPVSALVTYHQFVKPALAKLMGFKNYQDRFTVSARLAQPLSKSAGRLEFVRGILTSVNGELVVHPTLGQESHMLSGLAKANALIIFPRDAEKLLEGSDVEVQQLDWQLSL